VYFLNVENIRIINFRNYQSIGLKLNKNINIFIGNNAQGKTNLMEAIYMCSFGKSFRTNRDKEIINIHKDQAYVGANINIGQRKKLIEIKMERNKAKRIRVNKSELDSYKELYSGLSVVIFTPEDLKIVKEGPRERRGLLNRGIEQIRPVYNHNMSEYRKILYQRNNLLKSNRFKKDISSLLDVFDIQIAKIGTSIILERSRYLSILNNIVNDIHRQITKESEDLQLRYITNVKILEDRGEMERLYLKSLKNNIDRDLEYGTTEIGPHRDDISMTINHKDVRVYGSQGQQRTVVLSIVLSEVRLLKNEKGMYPVLILDDVFSELDDERKRYLTNFFKDIQTFITTTDYNDLKFMDNFKKDIFYIENGKLRTRNN